MIRKLSVIAGCGTALFLSYPPFNAGFLFIPAYTLLLVYLRSEKRRGERRRTLFFTFALFWFLSLQWMSYVNVGLLLYQKLLILAGAVLLALLMSLLWMLPFHMIDYKKSEIYLLPFIYAAIEYVFTVNGDLSFLWLTPGLSTVNYPLFYQSADLGGAYLITVWVLSISVLLSDVIIFKGIRRKVSAASAAIILAFIILYGFISMNSQFEGEHVKVDVVQPNLPAYMKQSYDEFLEARFELVKGLLEETKNDSSQLVVFPETASPVYLMRENIFSDYLLKFASENSKSILMGSLRLKYDRSKRMFDYYNSAFFISPGDTMQYYDKMRPVPFVERIPFDNRFIKLRKIDYGQGGFTPGAGSTVFRGKGIAFSAYICFESMFPTQVSKFTSNGARFLTNISEDVWFINSIAPYQHFAVGRMRSVENRRFVLRASNPGISAVIDPCGRVVKSLGINRRGIISADIIQSDRLTFFVKSGNIIPKLFLCIIFTYFIFKSVWRFYVSKIKNSPKPDRLSSRRDGKNSSL